MSIVLYTLACTWCAIAKATEIFSEDGSGEVTCSEVGQTFVLGERMPSRSHCHKRCWCAMNGRKQCDEVICEYPACFDPIHDDKEDCCPRCPNGANCKMDDMVLPQGHSIIQKLGHRCSNICICIYGGQEPTCVLQCDDVPPLDLLDQPKPRLKTRRRWQPIRRQKHGTRKHNQWLLT
ncbi:hypothetical protein LSH36_696g01107 [Paralvinella palmiformis]|uniref:VWFC domain-containing protein n=1 Tax=Paralvinella palmiformis TaxID=53620 RepID=A0AAD9J1Z8_9ANNE|nr:hypothetical protein LSH36_696g01107 [Paralvinella palmiformis]